LHEHGIGEQRGEAGRLFAYLVEAPLLADQHGAADRVDDVVVALGVHYPAVVQGVGVRRELVLDLQVVHREDDLPSLQGAVDNPSLTFQKNKSNIFS